MKFGTSSNDDVSLVLTVDIRANTSEFWNEVRFTELPRRGDILELPVGRGWTTWEVLRVVYRAEDGEDGLTLKPIEIVVSEVFY